MQKFSGIYMGRRRKQTGEAEAEMEGSGEDSEPQMIEGIARDLQRSIEVSQSDLVHHLQESQEATRRGQAEISETLKKVSDSQEMISRLLMQMTHGGKGPETYANKEASGSQGGNKHQQEHIPYYHTEGQSHGGGAPQGQTHSRTTHRPYLPSFLDEQPQPSYQDEFEDNFDQYVREYNSLSIPVQRQITLDQYCGLKFRGKTQRSYHKNNYELERRAGKMEIPYFDGSAKMTAQAWVQKLDTYLQLNPMREMDAIKFATMYLEGKAHDWWYHGLTTLGHNQIVAYTEFTQRLIDRFDQGDLELHFRELTQLRQTRSPEVYIEEFQRLAVMLQDVSQSRLMMLFTEGLMEPLKSWVEAFKPTNLQDAIWRTRNLGPAAKSKFIPRPPLNIGGRDQRPPMNQGGRDPRGFDRGRGRMDENTRRELRGKQLCYTCKEPWDPSHKCMGRGKAHYNEVTSDNEDEDFGHIQNIEADTTETAEEEGTGHNSAGEEKATLASISGVPKYNTFRMRGVLQGQKVRFSLMGVLLTTLLIHPYYRGGTYPRWNLKDSN
jgi:hypothetical protein